MPCISFPSAWNVLSAMSPGWPQNSSVRSLPQCHLLGETCPYFQQIAPSTKHILKAPVLFLKGSYQNSKLIPVLFDYYLPLDCKLQNGDERLAHSFLDSQTPGQHLAHTQQVIATPWTENCRSSLLTSLHAANSKFSRCSQVLADAPFLFPTPSVLKSTKPLNQV